MTVLRSFWCMLLLLPVLVSAQYSNPVHLSVRDGLPSSTVYALAQDRQGFMWFGTEGGLARFDGAHFRVFTTQDGLPDNEVLGVSYDSVSDRLWLVVYKADPCYYKAGKFYTGHNDSLLRKIRFRTGDFINLHAQPGLGVFLNSGYDVYRVAGQKIDKIPVKPLVCEIRSIHQWNDSLIDVMVGLWGILRHTDHVDSLYGAFCCDSSLGRGKWIGDRLFMYSSGVISVFDGHHGSAYSLKGRIQLEAKQNALSVIQRGGRYLISIAGSGVYAIDTSLQGALSPVWLGRSNDIAVDRAGDIWISTVDDGVYVIPNTSLANYQPDGAEHGNNLTAMAWSPSGHLYCGSSEGHIYSWDGRSLIRDKEVTGPGRDKVRALLSYDGDKVFMITNGDMAYFKEGGAASRIAHWGDTTARKAKFWAGGPKSLLKLSDSHTILIGMLASLARFDTRTGRYEEYPSYRRITALAQHPDGRVFCGSLDGIYTYRPDRDSVLQRVDTAGDRRITSLCFTSDSLLWIGTPSDGIWVFDGSRIVGSISAATDLRYHGAICRKIAAGRPGTVWIATNGGANRVQYWWDGTLHIDAITPFTLSDGLASDDVNDILIRDSIVFLATAGGLSVLNEHRLMATVPTSVYITSVFINDRDSGAHQWPYQLSHLQNNLRIEYVGVVLPSAAGLRYQYRLLGSGNDSWSTTSNTSLEFRSLAPGAYTFEVVALDKFGDRSESSAKVNFKIAPAFYQTIWFWVLAGIGVLAAGFSVIYWRFRLQRRRYEQEQGMKHKIIDLEQQALKAQMNPHFIFNCLTAVQHFVNKEDMYSANMYLSNFARLIRKTLDLSGEQYISLDEEIAYLSDYIGMECLRFGDKFTYEIQVDRDVDTFEALVPPMLLQPIIENAIRHGLRNRVGNDGRLQIRFYLVHGVLHCVVDDNGIGRKKAQQLKTTTHVEYQSKGMALTAMRIQAINQISADKISLGIEDKYEGETAAGTIVRLLIVQ